jgi:hypothetical protein
VQPIPETQFVAPANARRDQRILMLAALAGLALCVIGVRFFFWPAVASRFFGFIDKPNGFQLHMVVALRDLWLGALALAMVAFGEWRLLTVWLAAGALVCFGDAGIVWGSHGKVLSVLFHMGSGLFMTTLAILSWRRVRRDALAGDQRS